MRGASGVRHRYDGDCTRSIPMRNRMVGSVECPGHDGLVT